MKKLNNSLLLFRINTNNDTVKCFFVYFVGWFTYKIEVNTFDLKQLQMRHVIEFHEQLSNEWDSIYRI